MASSKRGVPSTRTVSLNPTLMVIVEALAYVSSVVSNVALSAPGTMPSTTTLRFTESDGLF